MDLLAPHEQRVITLLKNWSESAGCSYKKCHLQVFQHKNHRKYTACALSSNQARPTLRNHRLECRFRDALFTGRRTRCISSKLEAVFLTIDAMR
ncbi:hypothetical protein Bpro_0523 [Polaromonas sp. JS666]|nr:hypothetical protein Bpro_0523 [Polaromonas sp. JS666]